MQAKACNFIKKETLTQVFSCEFCEIFKNTFFHRATLLIRWLLLKHKEYIYKRKQNETSHEQNMYLNMFKQDITFCLFFLSWSSITTLLNLIRFSGIFQNILHSFSERKSIFNRIQKLWYKFKNSSKIGLSLEWWLPFHMNFLLLLQPLSL